MQTSDLALLSRYHEHSDAGAFQALVRLHGGMVFAAARRITGDPALAEEVAQDTFLALAKQGRGIRASLAAWLHHVVRQKARNATRGEIRRRRHEGSAAAEQPVVVQEDGGSWQDLEPLVDEALAELPERTRAVLIEHFLEQRTQQEVAARLGLNQSSVSRHITNGLEQLRARLRRKGVACGLGLGALLLAGTTEAAPASLMASMGRLAASGIGGAGSVPASGGLLFGTLPIMKLVLAMLAAALLMSAAGYDLASKDSRLAKWLAPSSPAPAGTANFHEKSNSAEAVSPTLQQQRWAAEARDIWARAPKTDQRTLDLTITGFMESKDVEASYAALQAVGIKVSRAAFDRLHRANVESVKKHRHHDLLHQVLRGWMAESPREAVAWARNCDIPALQTLEMVDEVLGVVAGTYGRQEPGAWAAFLAASPDPAIAAHEKVWQQIADDPPSLWALSAKLSLPSEQLRNYLCTLVAEDPPERALAVLKACPDAALREHAILGLATRMAPEQVLQLAATDFAASPALANFLRAVAGDPKASFAGAAAFALAPESRKGYANDYTEWVAECMETVYAQWIKADPAAALDQALAGEEHLARCMNTLVNAGSFTEEGLAESLAGLSAARRDQVLAAFLRAQANYDPAESLRLIQQSPFIDVSFSASYEVLEDWAKIDLASAAAWLRDQPPAPNQGALAAALVSSWAERDPQAAVAFAIEQGTHLADCASGLAFAIRKLDDNRLTPLLEPFRGDKDYNRMLIFLAGYRLPSAPAEAFQFIAAHANEDWQTLMVEVNTVWFNNDSRAEDYAKALPEAGLDDVPSGKLANLAARYAESLGKKNKLDEALDWTLRLPATAAPQARSSIAYLLAHTDAAQAAEMARWLGNAPLGGEERAELMKQAAAK